MDRTAVFVDAGYLLQEGGFACLGTRRRGDIDCDFEPLLEALGRYAEEASGLPLLRVYWYDAARGGVPFKDHLAVGRLPNVKLRLGRLVERGNRIEQKGVDSLIIRDLMTLARERAIDTACVIGGDEDLREGIVAAQDMGVRVLVVGVEHDDPNQSEALVLEADRHLVVRAEFLAPFFRTPERATTATGVVASELLAAEAGRDFARSCADSISRAQLGTLLTEYPRIPSELDVQLLRDAEKALGSLRDRFDLKVELRAGFWAGLSEAVAEGPGEDGGAS